MAKPGPYATRMIDVEKTVPKQERIARLGVGVRDRVGRLEDHLGEALPEFLAVAGAAALYLRMGCRDQDDGPQEALVAERDPDHLGHRRPDQPAGGRPVHRSGSANTPCSARSRPMPCS